MSKRCTLKPNAKCSPSQGSCCNSKLCDFERPGKVCMHSTECLYSVTCDGESARRKSHSDRFFKKNFTSCNSGTQVCINGVHFERIKFEINALAIFYSVLPASSKLEKN